MKYFISDLHMDSEKVVRYRTDAFLSIKEWAVLYQGITSKVGPDDILYILGDFAEKPEQYRQYMPKNVFLIKGNHDPSVSACRKVFGKNKVFDTKMIKIKDQDVFLSHYPHLAWPKSHYGSLHLYGHVHDKRTKFWDGIPELEPRRSLDVSPESYRRIFGSFGIFSEDDVLNLLCTKSGHDSVQWYIDNFGRFQE